VDNTNTTAAEIAPYYRIAQVWGHSVKVIRLHIDPFQALLRNTHNVPVGTVMAMYARMMNDTLPPFWNVQHLRAEL
jgi:hypothetical protein